MARLLIPLLLTALGAVACSGEIAAPDGASEEEDGNTLEDGDEGPAQDDGGSVEDDGGPVEDDGGPVEDDGGPVEDDGGPVEDDGGQVQDDGAPDGGDQGGPAGALSAVLRVDHLGWRPGDPKQAVLLGHAGEPVELRRVSDQGLAGSYTAGALVADEDSGDQVARVDFSDCTTPGEYYLLLAGAGLRSYPFRIAEDVYDVVGAAAMKSFYFQRCNHDRALPFAGDALAGFPGLGGRWVDGACHAGDAALGPGPGSADHGPLDLRDN